MLFRVKFLDGSVELVTGDSVSSVFRKFPDRIIKSIVEVVHDV